MKSSMSTPSVMHLDETTFDQTVSRSNVPILVRTRFSDRPMTDFTRILTTALLSWKLHRPGLTPI